MFSTVNTCSLFPTASILPSFISVVLSVNFVVKIKSC